MQTAWQADRIITSPEKESANPASPPRLCTEQQQAARYRIAAGTCAGSHGRGFHQGRGDMSAISDKDAVKVLIIDDSNTIRRSAEMFLRQAGYEVILAEDGFDALSKISDHRPRIIFVDVMMPRLDGYQTCALIKQNPHYRSTPVIMLSSKDGLFDRARGRLAGSDRYLTKPFNKEGLVNAVMDYTRDAVPA
jgi:twitching motility two-component system response regulator PilG